MKKLDQMFAAAVGQLLKEADEESENTNTAAGQIIWSPGSGNRSDVIKGLKRDANVSYRTVISKSAASGSKSLVLMGKLSVLNKATSRDPLISAGQILTQAVSSPIMSKLYGVPKVSENAVMVPIKLSMDPEDVRTQEGISGRNATVFIHLTLLGAYNARMFEPSSKLVLQTASSENGHVVIRKTGSARIETEETID